MMGWLQRLVHAILGRAPRETRRLDTAMRMAKDADLNGSRSSTSQGDRREPLRKGENYIPSREINPIEELQRIIGSDDRKPQDVPPSVLRGSAGPQPSSSQRRGLPRRRP